MSSFGDELKRERELRHISLREVAEATKIPLRYLEALEKNDFEHLPGGVFNRGFVRAYSEFIGVDPEAMVDAFQHEERSQHGEKPREAGPWRRGGKPSGAGPEHPTPAPGGAATRLWRWGAVVAAILALAALTLWWTVARGGAGRGPGGAAASPPQVESRE